MDGISRVRNLQTAPTDRHIWKLLRYYRDAKFASTRIGAIHKLPDPGKDPNVRKQAEQIGYCIQQAEEYFRAATHTSLATKPLLLYYGAVSLGSALVLFKKDGTHSFDALRAKRKHRHHGLELVEFSLPKAIPDLQETLRMVTAKLHLNDGSPWGNFTLFYESLFPSVVGVQLSRTTNLQQTKLESIEPQNCADRLPIAKLATSSFNALNLVKTLPDCYGVMQDFGIDPAIVRGSLKVTLHQEYENKDDKKILKQSTATHIFALNGVGSLGMETFLKLLGTKKSPFVCTDRLAANALFKWEQVTKPGEPETRIYYPDFVEDMHGELFVVLDPDEYLPELASYLILLFQFGMLARYYPDLWVRLISNSVAFSEFLDELLTIVERKFPNLILDQINGVKHRID